MNENDRKADAHASQGRQRSNRRIDHPRWVARFEQRTAPEPVFAAMMHVINRLDAGAAPATEIEEACARIYHNSEEKPRDSMSKLAREYMALPKALRVRTAPPSLVRLDPSTPLSSALLRVAYEESVRLGSSPVTPIIVDASMGSDGSICLLGNGFAVGRGEVSVTVQSLGRAVTEQIEVRPSFVSAGTIRFQLPYGLNREEDFVVRVVRHDEISLQVRDAIHYFYPDLFPDLTPPAPVPGPKITRLEPEGSRPGQVVYIFGENFKPYINMTGCRVHVEEEVNRRTGEGGKLKTGFAAHVLANGVEDENGWCAEVFSETQIILTLGYDIPPGRYSIRVSDDTTQKSSDLAPYKIIPWRFRVTFLNFSCTDESNEASGSDEIVTAWAVSADEHYFLKSTYEYEGVDQGGTYDYREEDRSILTPPD